MQTAQGMLKRQAKGVERAGRVNVGVVVLLVAGLLLGGSACGTGKSTPTAAAHPGAVAAIPQWETAAEASNRSLGLDPHGAQGEDEFGKFYMATVPADSDLVKKIPVAKLQAELGVSAEQAEKLALQTVRVAVRVADGAYSRSCAADKEPLNEIKVKAAQEALNKELIPEARPELFGILRVPGAGSHCSYFNISYRLFDEEPSLKQEGIGDSHVYDTPRPVVRYEFTSLEPGAFLVPVLGPEDNPQIKTEIASTWQRLDAVGKFKFYTVRVSGNVLLPAKDGKTLSGEGKDIWCEVLVAFDITDPKDVKLVYAENFTGGNAGEYMDKPEIVLGTNKAE